MTKEGKLKKRITKAYSEYYRGDGSFGSKITDAIIDDAKKDILTARTYKEIRNKILDWFGDSTDE